MTAIGVSYIQIGVSLQWKCHLNWNVIQIESSLKLEITQIEQLLDLECHSIWKTKWLEKV